MTALPAKPFLTLGYSTAPKADAPDQNAKLASGTNPILQSYLSCETETNEFPDTGHATADWVTHPCSIHWPKTNAL